jgi:flagellar protein FliS
MLYEGAIKFTKLGIKACEEKKIADRGMNIGRAFDIVMELNNTLDHKIGGDIAKNLEQLYMYIMDEYTKANITGKKEHLENAVKILENLYQGWVGAIEKLKKEQEGQGG